jgi:hypothetical protein
LQQAANHNADGNVRPPSSLTPFIHFLKLRKIESKIEQVIYRANKKSQPIHIVVQGFLSQLIAWKEAIPLEYHDQVNTKTGPFVGIDTFVSDFLKTIEA